MISRRLIQLILTVSSILSIMTGFGCADIRRKLGLDTNGENLGPFLRILLAGG